MNKYILALSALALGAGNLSAAEIAPRNSVITTAPTRLVSWSAVMLLGANKTKGENKELAKRFILSATKYLQKKAKYPATIKGLKEAIRVFEAFSRYYSSIEQWSQHYKDGIQALKEISARDFQRPDRLYWLSYS
jgi:hypothetical protein